MKRIVISILIFALSVPFFVACSDEPEVDMSYRHAYCEIAFDLPQNYTEMPSDTFDALFTNGQATVGITRLSFVGVEGDDLDGSMFPDKVARKYAEKNSLDVSFTDKTDHTYFEYRDGGYYNLIAFYRSKYAHFIVRFTCTEEKESVYAKEFERFASDAIFTQ